MLSRSSVFRFDLCHLNNLSRLVCWEITLKTHSQINKIDFHLTCLKFKHHHNDDLISRQSHDRLMMYKPLKVITIIGTILALNAFLASARVVVNRLKSDRNWEFLLRFCFFSDDGKVFFNVTYPYVSDCSFQKFALEFSWISLRFLNIISIASSHLQIRPKLIHTITTPL